MQLQIRVDPPNPYDPRCLLFSKRREAVYAVGDADRKALVDECVIGLAHLSPAYSEDGGQLAASGLAGGAEIRPCQAGDGFHAWQLRSELVDEPAFGKRPDVGELRNVEDLGRNDLHARLQLVHCLVESSTVLDSRYNKWASINM